MPGSGELRTKKRNNYRSRICVCVCGACFHLSEGEIAPTSAHQVQESPARTERSEKKCCMPDEERTSVKMCCPGNLLETS